MIKQGTQEWFMERCGKVTASRVAEVATKLKSGGYSALRATYMGELIAETLSGTPIEGFKSAAMQWGNDTEPQARAAYAFWTDNPVEQVGFVNHPKISLSGASPDGFVGIDGLVEIKCPNTATHIETLLSKTAPAKHIDQMQWQMECTGRDWCDFVSYDPRLPEDLALFVHRVPADGERQEVLRAEVTQFLSDMAIKIDALIEYKQAA